MKRNETVSALFWLLVGVVVATHAWRLGLGHLYEPGPGFIFFLSAGLLIVLSTVHLVTSFSSADKDRADRGRSNGSNWKGVRWKKLLLLLAGIAVYAFIFNLVGFICATFLLMFFLFKAIEPTHWLTALFSSAVTTGAAFAIFKMWLGVPFPPGMLGF